MQLSTARDLVRYHDARAAMYGAFAAWFSGLPAREALPDGLHHRARSLLPAPTWVDGFARALAALAPPGSADALRVLSFLSNEVAAAFHGEDLAEAAALCDAQRAFLDRHGTRVLEAAWQQLAASALPDAQALGASLRALVEDDGSGVATARGAPLAVHLLPTEVPLR